MKRSFATFAIATLIGAPAFAHDLGFAGLLAKTNKTELPELTLSVGKPIADAPLMLKSGGAYEIEIVADGTGELALEGSGFFRAIWVNEVVINGLEIRPFGLESLEFDDAGTMEIEFVAIKPGRYFLRQPGTTSEGRMVEIVIE